MSKRISTTQKIDDKTGMYVMDGFSYNPQEIEKARQELVTYDLSEDFDVLCDAKEFKATYHELNAFAKSKKVHLKNVADHDIMELAMFIEEHPYLYVAASMEKELNSESTHYKLYLNLIGTLSEFGMVGKGKEDKWRKLINYCMDFNPTWIEASRQVIDEDDNSSCLLNFGFGLVTV